ncbi:MAG: spore cortex biosynthesis protein YabQ [Clostridia bacterium]|nr:spore cortex biosynthesis protein YabQ [Clostridia bacterium]
MTYVVSSFEQISNFLSAVGLGFLVGVLYVAVSFFRSFFGNGKVAYFVSDFLFCLISAFLSFCFFLVYSRGEIRPELFFAQAVGFSSFMLTAGKYASFFLKKVSRGARKIQDFVLLPFRKLEKFLLKISKRIKNKICLGKEKFLKMKKKTKEKCVQSEEKNNKKT